MSQLFNDKILEIDVKKIIMKKDKENATKFVEALYIMIQMLAQNMKLEEEKGEGILDDLGEEVKSHSFNDNRMNLSEKKETEKMRRNKDEEINLENLESLRLGKDKDIKIILWIYKLQTFISSIRNNLFIIMNFKFAHFNIIYTTIMNFFHLCFFQSGF